MAEAFCLSKIIPAKCKLKASFSPGNHLQNHSSKIRMAEGGIGSNIVTQLGKAT